MQNLPCFEYFIKIYISSRIQKEKIIYTCFLKVLRNNGNSITYMIFATIIIIHPQ